MTDKALFLDVQGFGRFSDNTFVVKELAVMSIPTDDAYKPAIKRVLFKSPCSWVTLPRESKNLNTWLTQNYHGLEWTEGDTPYKDVAEAVNEIVCGAIYIFVKGSEKKDWLEKIIAKVRHTICFSNSVIDLESLDCPSSRILRREFTAIRWHGDCHWHTPEYRCAFENVQRLHGWYSKECRPSIWRSLCIYIQVQCISRMNSEDLAFLTKQFMLIYGSSRIGDVWCRLPLAMREDKDIAEYRRCSRHHIAASISPMVKDCSQCKASK